jgi:hypothetical protein
MSAFAGAATLDSARRAAYRDGLQNKWKFLAAG